eukprot:scaffold7970_cov187-Amphora_coffeaeformis.AAC.2
MVSTSPNQRQPRFRGTATTSENDNTSIIPTTMAPVFGSGMNQRKGKSPSPKIQDSLGISNGNDDEKSNNSKGLFRRSKYRGKYATAIFLVMVLAPALLIYASIGFFGPIRAKNPGWGKHPRVTTLWKGSETLLGTPVIARLPELSHEVPPIAKKSFFQHLEDSRSYNHGRADQFETETCKAQYDWQLHSFPTCNLLHEREMESLIVRPENKEEPLELVANGYWRDVWILPSSNFDGNHVLKTIRYEHDWEERNYDRHRRDALAMERLSDNPYVLNIYAFCGNSGVSEYADGGDISDAIWPHNAETGKREYATMTKVERLHIGEFGNAEKCGTDFIRLFVNQLEHFPTGVQAAMGLAAVHNCDKEGRPSIAHTDIAPGQFVRVGDIFKLNDFNRARFLRTNITNGSICGFEVGNNPGKNRSPEEYMYKPETEKVRLTIRVART